jgi:hypothetical protein
MAKEAAFSCVLLLMSCVLFSSDACSQTGDCSGAVGQWEFRVFGRDCKGYEEEGKFVMTVDADCNLQNDRFYATVDFTVDQCSILVLKGKIIDGKKIEGTYRYEDGGGGTFKAVKKKSGRKQPKEETGAPLFTF